MDSEDYDVLPATNTCTSTINKQLVIPTPGTATSQNLNNVNAIGQQHLEDSKYDDTDAIQVKQMYGGNVKNLKTFKIIFRKKKYLVNSNNEKNAITDLLNIKNIKNTNYKKDYLIHIEEINNNTKKTNNTNNTKKTNNNNTKKTSNKSNFYVLESFDKNNKINKKNKNNKNNNNIKNNIKKIYQ